MNDFRFPKSEKLKKKNEIDLLFQKGKWKSAGNVRIILGPKTENSTTKIGVSVSKKFFKKAVDRNRIKRLLRECYRLNKSEILQKLDGRNAMIFWISKDLPKNYHEVLSEFLAVCEKI